MKIRTDFVTNSSSSGFVVIRIDSKSLDALLNEKKLDKSIFSEIEEAYGGENGNPGAIKSSVSLSLCCLLLSDGMPFVEAYEEISDNLHEAEPSEWNDLVEAVTDAIQSMREIDKDEISEDQREDADQFQRLLELILLVNENKDKIDADATALIESGCASSDSGGPDFEYSRLDVKDGKGSFVGYSAYDDYYGDDENPTALYKWAKKHGYYNPANERPGFQGGYDASLYFDPPYQEVAESFPDATHIQIGGDS